jgi:Leucine-rich repeat (LRR) protein
MINPEAIKRIIECEENRSKSLDLSKLGLTSVPEEIAHLFWLEQLNLSNNDIRKISNLEKLEKLKVIGLSTNQIQKLKELRP